MRYRKLTETNDYSFGLASQSFLTGIDAICQTIRTKILLFYGEWWENISVGIPMFQSILGQMDPNSLKVSSSLLLQKRILEVPGVISVNSIDVEVVKRTMKFFIDVKTTEGNAELEVAV